MKIYGRNVSTHMNLVGKPQAYLWHT